MKSFLMESLTPNLSNPALKVKKKKKKEEEREVERKTLKCLINILVKDYFLITCFSNRNRLSPIRYT